MAERRAGIDRARFAELPLAVVLKIDQLADDFESDWLAGNKRSIDEFVQEASVAGDAARLALESHLRELRADLEAQPSPRGRTQVAARQDTIPATTAAATSIPEPSVEHAVTVGEYRLLDRLGEGGMGIVFKALHTKLDSLVAIKFPRFAEALDRPSALRFLREARIIGRLRHQNIVRALDAGESQYGPFLVTDFIDGETVEDLVQREGPLVFDRCLALAIQAARGLGYAHSQGVVHRDIKPSNMLIDERGTLRVVDFGLAKGAAKMTDGGDASTSATETIRGTFLGTVGYAAPEQLWTDDPIDQRADVYGLGCVMFFMLSGEAPHKGTLSERLLAHQGDSGSDVRQPVCPTSPSFAKTWRRMVAKSPADRFSTMAEVENSLQSDMQAWQHGERAKDTPKPFPRFLAAAVAGVVLLALAAVFSSSSNPTAATKPNSPAPPRAIAPFDAKQGELLQQQWADYLGSPVRVENSIGMRFVLVPAGEFQMGLADPMQSEPQLPEDSWRYVDPEVARQQQLPRHRVVLTSAYYFGETEVTFAQFERFVNATDYVTDAERASGWGKEDQGWLRRAGYSWKNTGQWLSKDDHPVMNVSWNDAVAFAQWLGEIDDLGQYRLPTEAEWEFACRAGTETTYYFGDDPASFHEHAWYKENFKIAFHRVGQKKPNPFGLYDMYGNRQEWCQDVFSADFYQRSPLSDPVCRSGGNERVLRGGTHTDLAAFCTSARRWSQPPESVGATGFRVVCVPK